MGESYFLKGDSGGPSFQIDPESKRWLLVGVHSSGQTEANYTRVRVEAHIWRDVHVGRY